VITAAVDVLVRAFALVEAVQSPVIVTVAAEVIDTAAAFCATRFPVMLRVPPLQDTAALVLEAEPKSPEAAVTERVPEEELNATPVEFSVMLETEMAIEPDD
jgi:hypothetical protein